MDHDAIEAVRSRNTAWRLLRANNAALILSFLGAYFVDGNRGARPATEVCAALDDHLYSLNTPEDPRYPKAPQSYLEDWSGDETGYLRRFYPAGQNDEAYYEVTSAFEKAYAWVESLRGTAFVGTESRLHTVVELLRQIVHGSDEDPQARLAQLHRQRQEIDAQIAAVEAGEVSLLDETGVRDRYQQFAATARGLLADFREVEENFRLLDRAAREKIAGWEGSKGELVADLVGSRSGISDSDQGRSFRAFYDFLLSESRQDELADLLARAARLPAIDADRRMRTIHHDWSEAAERAQHTVRQISEQLRRFLDDQVWLENRRVLELLRAVETAALAVRADPPDFGLTVDEPGIEIALPFERPLYAAPANVEVESLIQPADQVDLEAEALFAQSVVDQLRLAQNIRSLLPERSSAPLEEIIALYPIEQGAAEIVGYLALADEDLRLEMDDADETVLDYPDPTDPDRLKRARLPKVTVRRQ